MKMDMYNMEWYYKNKPEKEEKAKEELNMDYLKKNQIRYIEVEN